MEADDKFKIGYDGAMKMLATESSVIWHAFTALLAANAFMITLTAAALKFFPKISIGATAIGVAGILLCIAWFFTMKRQFSYLSYWILWAQVLEKQYLAPEIQMLTLGRQYGEGDGVDLPRVGRKRAPWAARTFRVQWLATFVIIFFAVFYAFILYLSLVI